jgi:hypothetical protein
MGHTNRYCTLPPSRTVVAFTGPQCWNAKSQRIEAARFWPCTAGLTVVQSYDIHCASRKVGLICRNKNNRVDLNSTRYTTSRTHEQRSKNFGRCHATSVEARVWTSIFSTVQFLSDSCKEQEEQGEDKSYFYLFVSRIRFRVPSVQSGNEKTLIVLLSTTDWSNVLHSSESCKTLVLK